MTYKTVFTTERGQLHQQHALDSAPPELDIIMLRQPDKATLLAHISDAVYIISERTGVIDADMLRAAPQLKLILRLGSMTHDINLDAAKSSGIIVCYHPSTGAIRVAEHVVMQMLTLTKQLHTIEETVLTANQHGRTSKRTNEDTFAYNWSNQGNIGQIYQSTVGILGFGEIGAELARRLLGWQCTVLYNKRRRLPQHVEDELGITYTARTDLISGCDFLVNLLPYSAATDQSLNAAIFAKMREGAFVVSAGSGSVINEQALANAVLSGKLGGAALDTYEWEPILPDNPMLTAAKTGANIVLTPHTAAGGHTPEQQNQKRAAEFENIRRHLNGEPILNRVV